MYVAQYRRLRCIGCGWLLAAAVVALALPAPVLAQDGDRELRSRSVPLLKPERLRSVGQQAVRVELEPESDQEPADVTVVAGAAHVAQASNGSVVLEQAQSSTSVVSVAGPKASSPQRLGSLEQKLKLPWLVVDSQARDTYNVVRSAQPFIKLARAVQWDPERKLHIAELLIGLDAESGDGGALAEPLVASLAVTCDSVEPQSVRFSTIGSAGDQLVHVECSPNVKNERSEQVLSLRLQGAEYDYAFEIPHRPGRFELQASTSSVLGMGLGELTLTAVQREEDGTELTAREPIVVPLHVDNGELIPDSLTIPAGSAQGVATVHLRGSGELQLRAGLAERESPSVPIHVRLPILLTAMAPLGGALGGFMAARWQSKHPSRKYHPQAPIHYGLHRRLRRRHSHRADTHGRTHHGPGPKLGANRRDRLARGSGIRGFPRLGVVRSRSAPVLPPTHKLTCPVARLLSNRAPKSGLISITWCILTSFIMSKWRAEPGNELNTYEVNLDD